MTRQSRKGAMVESAANLFVGFSFAFLINYVALNVLGVKPTAGALFWVGLAVTVASVLRSFCMRRIFEGVRIKKAPPEFLYIVDELAAERHRQITGEGYSLDHDDAHIDGELADGAGAYCLASAFIQSRGELVRGAVPYAIWPWEAESFKPESARRCLVKAGAMIIAEIGRRDRANDRRAAR